MLLALPFKCSAKFRGRAILTCNYHKINLCLYRMHRDCSAAHDVVAVAIFPFPELKPSLPEGQTRGLISPRGQVTPRSGIPEHLSGCTAVCCAMLGNIPRETRIIASDLRESTTAVKYFRTLPQRVTSRPRGCAIDEINTRRLSRTEMSIDLFAGGANATLTPISPPATAFLLRFHERLWRFLQSV